MRNHIRSAWNQYYVLTKRDDRATGCSENESKHFLLDLSHLVRALLEKMAWKMACCHWSCDHHVVNGGKPGSSPGSNPSSSPNSSPNSIPSSSVDSAFRYPQISTHVCKLVNIYATRWNHKGRKISQKPFPAKILFKQATLSVSKIHNTQLNKFLTRVQDQTLFWRTFALNDEKKDNKLSFK